MVVAEFKGNETTKYVGDVYQYDLGQVLCIKGLNLPKFVEIDFALQETGSTTESEVGITKNGVTEVEIPNHMLINNDTDANYMIYAFVYLTDETSGETIRKIRISVKARSKPEAFDKPEDGEIFREAIKAVNDAADRAESAEKQAEGWAHGREDLPERTEDNAKYYSEQAREAVNGIDGQVEDAKQRIDEYVKGKEQELKGETGDVYFAAFKVVNGRLKMYSDPELDKVRFVRIGSRLKYVLAF